MAMKRFILLVTKPYSFPILNPVYRYLVDSGIGEVRWFLGKNIKDQPVPGGALRSNSEVLDYNPDAVLVPGNVVPDFWPGLKVQIFHGLGEEKKGHYRVTGFFDLYCTPGPFMTNIFNALAEKYKTFLVRETGWPKLDAIPEYLSPEASHELIQFKSPDPILLYAPTFSPRYTSAPDLLPQIQSLLDKPMNWIIKFHDLMDKDIIRRAKRLACDKLKVIESDNILPAMAVSDMLIADTSSVTYEYLLFDKPIITYKSTCRLDKGLNLDTPDELFGAIVRSLEDPDELSAIRKLYRAELHPYHDGKSSERLINTVHDVLEGSELSQLKRKRPAWIRRRQVRKQFSA